MQTLSSLEREHQLISGLLGALHSYADRLRGSLPPDAEDLPRFASTFRELVDYRHHEKEESILLPLLARNGFVWSSGSLAEVRREHSHLRYLMDVIYQAAARELTWSHDERRKLADAVVAFVDFKRRHMQKEQVELFPTVLRRLEAAALVQLEAELAQFDEATGRSPELEHARQTAELLVQRYLGPAAIDLHEPLAPVSGVVTWEQIRRAG
jgi:hemerythrin-like domain-containing protein